MNAIIFNNTAELIELMLKIDSGSGVGTLETTTKPKRNVKSRSTKEPFDVIFPNGEINITKREYVNVGINYENAVNNQRGREGSEKDFVAESLPWGDWFEGSHIVIAHKGKFYLRYYISMNFNYQHSEKVYHTVSGEELSENETARFKAEFLPVIKDGKEKQGVDKAVQPRTVNAENLTRLVYGGKVFIRNGFLARQESMDIEGWHNRTVDMLNRRRESEGATA